MMKKYRILFGNNTLKLLAGTETWVKTLALQFAKMGHYVVAFSPELGIISDQLKKEGIPCYDQIPTSGVNKFSFKFEESQNHSYDVIIANHHHIVEKLRELFPTTPIISTIHGIIHEQETPEGIVKAPEHPALTSGVNQFVAVSEEVQAVLKEKYNIEALLVRNFISPTEFKQRKKISSGKPKVILLNTNYASKDDSEVVVLRNVAKHYGAKLAAIGENFVLSQDMPNTISDVDIVIGMGRSVLEGLMAGRLCIVHGRWGTGGVVEEGAINALRAQNFSGRNSKGKFWTEEEFIQAIDQFYNPRTIKWGIEYAKREHNVLFAADQFLNMIRMLTGEIQNKSPEVKIHPFRRQSDVDSK